MKERLFSFHFEIVHPQMKKVLRESCGSSGGETKTIWYCYYAKVTATAEVVLALLFFFLLSLVVFSSTVMIICT